MKKINGFKGKAGKIKGDGHIAYELLVDNDGELYVKFIDNEVNTNSPGTFSTTLYSVKLYAAKRNSNENIGHPKGIDEATRKPVTPDDNNNGAFLKAVLRDLLP